ncbi:MAG: hypothetical protein GF350_02335 [Chitinivibrionales bacterium]|nr:hypothetical protein [Chitinivibrionales bacterium]
MASEFSTSEFSRREFLLLGSAVLATPPLWQVGGSDMQTKVYGTAWGFSEGGLSFPAYFQERKVRRGFSTTQEVTR